MARLNLTLGDDTFDRLEKRAIEQGKARSAVARELLVGALDRLAKQERLQRLARDYAADRADAAAILAELEAGQLELLDD
jgi:hypothetical protein